MKNFADKICIFADEKRAFVYYIKIYCNVLKLISSYGCI